MQRSAPLTAAAIVAALAVACAGEDAAPATNAPEPAATAPPPTEPPATEPGDGGGPTEAPPRRGIRLATIARGLDQPTYVASPPGDSRLFIVEKTGRVRIMARGRLAKPPFLDLRGRVSTGSEQGLLSIAFHPRYARNGRFYVDFTDPAGDTRVVEYRTRPDGRSAAPGSARELLFVDQPYSNHNGGQLQFGPDGLLYVGMGDGGSAGDPEGRAQDPRSRLGKLLRIDVDRPGAAVSTYASGLRNPWRFSFDRASGDLWIGDVGQGDWEEIDRLPAGSPPGANFGWDVYEGSHVYEEGDLARSDVAMPVAEYSHGFGCSVTGGYVYRGEDVADLRGRYVYADFCSGYIWALRPGGAPQRLRLAGAPGSIASFGEDAAGELYLTSLDGSVHRFVPGR
jgi:glucose/arabinose dehydrogenase